MIRQPVSTITINNDPAMTKQKSTGVRSPWTYAAKNYSDMKRIKKTIGKKRAKSISIDRQTSKLLGQ